MMQVMGSSGGRGPQINRSGGKEQRKESKKRKNLESKKEVIVGTEKVQHQNG